MNSPFSLTKHAVLRMAQRNISREDLRYVLEHGERIHKTGVTIYSLRKRDIPRNDLKESKIARLEGTVVLTGYAQDGQLEVITLYRNKSASREFRRKEKYDNRRDGKHRNLSSHEW